MTRRAADVSTTGGGARWRRDLRPRGGGGVLGNQLTKDAVWAWVLFVGALLMGAVLTSLVAFYSAAAPATEASPAVLATDPRAAREARRPYYEDARTKLEVLAEDFYEVYSWIAKHGAGARKDAFGVLEPTRGHPFHTPPFGPLSRALDDSVARARTAVSAMEWSGIVPDEVSREVSWVVESADRLHDTCKAAYISVEGRLVKWLRDAENLRLVTYWDAMKAMKQDLASPADK
jgi:hypothetical protein